MTAIERLDIEDWGKLHDLRLELHPGLNLLLGEHGTGKSLALMLLYWASAAPDERPPLPRSGTGRDRSMVTLATPGGAIELTVPGEAIAETVRRPALFLPVHWPEDPSRAGPWEAGLTRALLAQNLTRQALVPVRSLMDLLRDTLSGETVGSGDGLAFRPERGETTPLALLSDGQRRLAILHALLRSGGLPGSLVCWDLPETTLSLSMLGPLAGLVLGLAGLGAQVILATHSYVLARELSLIAEGASAIRYHVFAEDRGTPTVRGFDQYELLEPNPPLEAHGRLYDRGIRHALS
jgi:hypothetical protein